MRLNRRVSLAMLSGVGAVLAGVLLFDVYEDWVVQGNTLASTVAENALPFVFLTGLFYAVWNLRRDEYDGAFVSSVTTWTVIGTLTATLLVGWVVGIQVRQNELKPWIVVLQTAVIGAGAGLLVGHNIATVERARDRSRRRKERFESLFENDPAAIADLRLDGDRFVVKEANPEYERQFGADGGTESVDAVLPGVDAETMASFREATAAGERRTVERTHSTPEGRKHFVIELVPYGASDEIRSYVIYRDQTEMREAEAELERTVEQLERSNEQLQQFAYVASHDLQEPLRMVSSYVDLLASEYEGELDDEADEYIEFAVDGAQRMQAMIDALLEYSRVHTQGEEFKETDAEAVLERVLQDLELLIEERNATVTHDDLPTVVADESQLGQVFQNLVSNAIEHADDGSPPSVHVSGEERSDRVVFSVADDGAGIPPDQQERLFEIFEQSSRDDEGTGIGLAICQRIVDRHEGDIWIDSTDGDGTTFHVAFPKR